MSRATSNHSFWPNVICIGLVIHLIGVGLSAEQCEGCSPRAQFGDDVLYFSQVVWGNGSLSRISIHNPGLAAADAFITIYADGDIIRDTLVIGGKNTEVLILEDDDGPLRVGWIRIGDSGVPFMATEYLDIAVGEESLPLVGVLPSRPTTSARFFGFVQQSLKSGIAVANPSKTDPVRLAVRLLNQSGRVIRSTVVAVEPLSHTALFLDQKPLFSDLENFEGLVEVTAEGLFLLTTLTQDGENNLGTVAVFTADPD